MAQEQQLQSSPKKTINPLASVSKGLTNWFSMLSGKGAVKETSTSTAQAADPKKAEMPQEDSVKQDFEKAKAFLDKTMSKFGTTAAPTLEKGKQLEGKGVAYAKKVVDVNFATKAVRIFIVIFFAIILVFISSRVFKLIGGQQPGPSVPTPTTAPTVPPLKGTEPSIYANDALILKIEEEAKVLVNEIVGKNLDDDSIALPDLDTNINFLK